MDLHEEATVSALRDMLHACYLRDPYPLHARLVSFAEELRARHPDHHRCRLYHLLVGSSPIGNYVRFDFPGADSVERFVEQAHQNLAGVN